MVSRVRGRGRGSGVEVDATALSCGRSPAARCAASSSTSRRPTPSKPSGCGLAASMATLESIGLDDGYAQLGDVRFHYVEAGERPARRPAPRLPGVLVRLAPADPGAGGGRLSRRRAGHARLQPLVAPCGRRRLRHRSAGGRRPRPDPRARRRPRLRGRPRLGGGRPPGRRRRTTRRRWSGWRS